ncbi:MAG: hypothetical protein ABII76_16255 [Pseudomonadota bacterium]
MKREAGTEHAAGPCCRTLGCEAREKQTRVRIGKVVALRARRAYSIFMSIHKFSLGDHVELSIGPFYRATAGAYDIVALMPFERGECSYRVRASAEKHERVVLESDLRLIPRPEGMPVQMPSIAIGKKRA